MKLVRLLSKFVDWCLGWIPTLWGFLWVLAMTFGSCALLVLAIKWLASVMGWI